MGYYFALDEYLKTLGPTRRFRVPLPAHPRWQCASTSGGMYRLRRRKRVLLAMTVGLLLPLGITAAPAFAGKNASAPITESCRSGQTMTAVQFQLTDVPKWQKITVRTENGSLTRDHDSFTGSTSGGTASYDIAIDSKLTGAPAIAYISDDAWTGTFQMTGASCRSPEAPRVSGEGSPCGSEARVTVRVANPNQVTVSYRVGGQLPSQGTEVGGGESETVVFGQVERGRGYRVTAEGDDGTVGSTWVNVPACSEATPSPANPTTQPTVVVPQPGTPAAPVASTSAAAPAPVVPSANASTATSASASAAPSASATVSASASPTPVPVPTVEVDVDPFEPLLQAEVGKSMTILAAPASAKEMLTNGLTLTIVIVLAVILLLGTALALRRRPHTGRKQG